MSSASDPDSAVDVSLPFTFYKTLKQRATFNALLWKLEMGRIGTSPKQIGF